MPSLGQREGNLKRFWKYVDKNGPVHPLLRTRCWQWTAGKVKGYGYFWLEGKTVKAYRFSYQIHHGEIPDSLGVMHECDNPGCVNPNHIKLGTTQDNRADCVEKKRHATGDRHGSRTKPENFPKGEDSPVSVLTEQDVADIKSRYQKWSSKNGTYALAKEYGVCQATIWRIVTGQSWKHMP